jgi:hypothetical protein
VRLASSASDSWNPRSCYRATQGRANAVYLTPHHWTEAGRSTDPRDVIQPDLGKWTYRNQVLATTRLAPWQRFALVKLTEALCHLRPRARLRLVWGGDRRVRRILRSSLAVGVRVVAAEVAEFLLATQFVPRGTLDRGPPSGSPRSPPAPTRLLPSSLADGDVVRV